VFFLVFGLQFLLRGIGRRLLFFLRFLLSIQSLLAFCF